MQATSSDQLQIGRNVLHNCLGKYVRQAIIFDANNFCHHIFQLTQLISGNIPHPERFDHMIYIEQGEESLPHFFSNLQEESLQQSV